MDVVATIEARARLDQRRDVVAQVKNENESAKYCASKEEQVLKRRFKETTYAREADKWKEEKPSFRISVELAPGPSEKTAAHWWR